jgi:hypothetical protein
MPEIYRNDALNAWQWQWLSLYSRVYQGGYFYVVGSMTQWGACQQVSDPDCETLDNTPSQGWTQLALALNSDPITAQSNPDYSTDIKWGDK